MPVRARSHYYAAVTGVRGALRWMMLCGLLLLVVLPRFNLRDPQSVEGVSATGTVTSSIDVEAYIELAKYFDGRSPAASQIPPYCYRPLVPLAASLLPFDTPTSINLVDILCLLMAMVVLDRMLRVTGYARRYRTLGCAMFVVSFPSFYYGAIGLVDPAAVFVTTLLAYLTLRERHASFAAALVLGVLVKETNGLMAVLPAAWAWAQGRVTTQVVARTALLIALAATTIASVWALSPFPTADWFWGARFERIGSNLARPRAYLSLALTVGPLGALGLAAMVSGRARQTLGPPRTRFFQAGIGLAVSLYLWSWFTAYADGRVIWIAYPFLIPLALAALSERVAEGHAGRREEPLLRGGDVFLAEPEERRQRRAEQEAAPPTLETDTRRWSPVT